MAKHAGALAVAQRLQEVGLHAHAGKPDSLFQNEVGVRNPERLAEPFLEGLVEIMEEARIVDDTRLVDLTEADGQLGRPLHAR